MSFYVGDLSSDSAYRVLLFSVNPKGRSEPIVIDGFNSKGVAQYAGTLDERMEVELSPVLAGLAGLAALLLVFSCCVLGVLYFRHSNK